MTRIAFNAGGSRLTAGARVRLRGIIEKINNGGVRVLIVGHGDADGTREANFAMSQQRARPSPPISGRWVSTADC